MESPLADPPESLASVSPLTDASGVSGRAWQPSQHLPPPDTFLFPSCQPSVNPTTWHPLQEFCFHPVCTSSLPHHLQTGTCGSGLPIQCPSGAPQPRAPPPILQLSTLTKPACGGGRASWNQTLPVRRAILHGAGGSCRWRVGGAEPDPGPVLGPALSPTSQQRLQRVWSLVLSVQSWAEVWGSALCGCFERQGTLGEATGTCLLLSPALCGPRGQCLYVGQVPPPAPLMPCHSVQQGDQHCASPETAHGSF